MFTEYLNCGMQRGKICSMTPAWYDFIISGFHLLFQHRFANGKLTHCIIYQRTFLYMTDQDFLSELHSWRQLCDWWQSCLDQSYSIWTTMLIIDQLTVENSQWDQLYSVKINKCRSMLTRHEIVRNMEPLYHKCNLERYRVQSVPQKGFEYHTSNRQ